MSALDAVIVPVGGGGLISGISTAFKAISPNCKVIGVEATGVPSLYESMKKKKLVTIEHPATIADGLIGQTIGKLNFEISERNVDDVVLVTDNQLREAVKSLLLDSHILAEPSGAAPVAALLSGAYKPRARRKNRSCYQRRKYRLLASSGITQRSIFAAEPKILVYP